MTETPPPPTNATAAIPPLRPANACWFPFPPPIKTSALSSDWTPPPPPPLGPRALFEILNLSSHPPSIPASSRRPLASSCSVTRQSTSLGCEALKPSSSFPELDCVEAGRGRQILRGFHRPRLPPILAAAEAPPRNPPGGRNCGLCFPRLPPSPGNLGAPCDPVEAGLVFQLGAKRRLALRRAPTDRPMARPAAALLAVCWAAALCWAGADALGMNWGTQATHPLPPRVVVQVLRDNGIKKVKLFDTDPAAMKALAGSGIEVMAAIPNNMLADLAADAGRAKDWVKRNVQRYDFDGGVTIKYVAVGNEPFLESYNGSFINVTFPALQNIQNALNDAGVGDRIKATVPLNADVYNSPAKDPVPSAGRFRADIAGLMTDIVSFLAKNKAPFTVNIYPFLSLYLNDNFPLDYAFFDGGATPVNDHGVLYTNVFDANFDTLVAALRAAGHGDMPVVVGEVGWPTDGDKHAKASYAQRFYAGLLRRLAANAGTPARPGQYMEVYLFGLVDEDAKSVAPGNFERHWGILRYDGQPKYALDLAGQGRNTMPAPAKGVRYLPRTWCALNPGARDLGKLGANIDYACTFADCTPLGYGSTCNGMDAAGNASYAFNAYYQAQSQKDEACDFQGLALPTETDPSTAACNFTIQIETGAAARGRGGGAAAGAVLVAAALLLQQLLALR